MKVVSNSLRIAKFKTPSEPMGVRIEILITNGANIDRPGVPLSTKVCLKSRGRLKLDFEAQFLDLRFLD